VHSRLAILIEVRSVSLCEVFGSLTSRVRIGTRMAEQFVGYAVSVTCHNDLGSYQGQICNVDPKEQTITLKKAFKNGIPCQVSQITLR
jgi:hypothetical protein